MLPGGEAFRRAVNLAQDAGAQVACVTRFFDEIGGGCTPPGRMSPPPGLEALAA
jgi:hypothetical protein